MCPSCLVPHKTGVTSFELSFIGPTPVVLVLLALVQLCLFYGNYLTAEAYLWQIIVRKWKEA